MEILRRLEASTDPGTLQVTSTFADSLRSAPSHLAPAPAAFPLAPRPVAPVIGPDGAPINTFVVAPKTRGGGGGGGGGNSGGGVNGVEGPAAAAVAAGGGSTYHSNAAFTWNP
jgi:hypothetical protein